MEKKLRGNSIADLRKVGRDSEGGAELCGVGKWAQRAKLLKKGHVSNQATAHST